MTAQTTLPISEQQELANNDKVQAKQAISSEIKAMRKRGENLKIQKILQLIKNQDCELSKDEILEIICSNKFLGGQELGQFNTPNEIAELISSIGMNYNPKSVLDISCGTGNILAYLNTINTVTGMDINHDAALLAKFINPNAEIITANSLIYDFSNAKYDLVVGQPPFALIQENKRNAELEIIKKGLDLLNPNGVAIFVVYDGILSNSSANDFRQHLLSNFAMDMIISLPNTIFPYTSVKSSILVIRKGQKNKHVFMPSFEDSQKSILEDYKQHRGEFYLPISKLIDRFDRNHYLTLEAIDATLKGHKLIKISDVSKVIGGKYLNPKVFKTSGKYLLFNRNDKNGKNFVDEIPDEHCVLRNNDFVVSLIGPNNKIHLYNEDGIKTVISQNFAIIRPTKEDKYISTYLKTSDGEALIQQQMNRHLVGSTIPHLSVLSLKDILIPLLSLEELNNSVSKTTELVSKATELNDLLLKSSECIKNKEYNLARMYIEQAFKNANSEISQHRNVYLENINNLEEIEKKDIELEETMAMFAHKFRSPLDAIIYNTSHEHQPKLYIQAAQTMRGLLDIFSIISTDSDSLKERLSQDNQGKGNLINVLAKTLDMILLHLLSVSSSEKIQQHYLRYAKAHGLCSTDVSDKQWNEDYFELEQQLQVEWEQSFAQLLNESPTLQQRLDWLALHFFKLEVQGFAPITIQFREYGITESFLTILLNEILVNAFKYYASTAQQPVYLSWSEQEGYQILSCRNPSINNERSKLKGSGKGHTFLSALARKTGSQFNKPKANDDFVLEFGIANPLLINSQGNMQ